MNFSPTPRRSVAALAFISTCLLAGNASADAIKGAIFTTTADGQIVNGNNYANKSDVYLNGGPTKAPCQAGKIETGNYYFQVTSPSGATLLSTDLVTDRGFSVADGVIVGYAGPHGHSVGPCLSDTVQLIPYSNTPNAGGVYKVWVTRQADYAPGLGQHGFVPGNTKTDNFRIKPSVVSYKGIINVYKFYDSNGNGMWDGDEKPLRRWLMTLTPPEAGNSKLTNIDGLARYGGLLPNTYAVTEGVAGGTWVHSGSVVDGIARNPVTNPITDLVLDAGETINVEFGNYCTCASGGHTLGFWSNKNGYKKMYDGYTVEPELQMLRNLNLRNADGSHFDPTTYAEFRTWLLDATATNMANMLSAQLAAMALNIESHGVNPANVYLPYGGTIADLVDAANELLSDGMCGSTCSTVAASQLRTDQETLKNFLDELNNNATVIRAKPCAYKFYLPTTY